MNVKEFLQLDKPEIFDFSGEFASEVYRSASPCEKYIIYKAYTINNDWADCFASGKEFCAGIKKCFTNCRVRFIIKQQYFNCCFILLKTLLWLRDL